MLCLLLLLLVISHAAEKGRCSLPPLTWFKDHRFSDKKPQPKQASIKIVTANDAPSCATFCSDEASCSAFFYNPKTLACDLQCTVYTSSVKLVDAPGYVYYRIVSDGCPVNRCYHLLRLGDDTLCITLLPSFGYDYLDSRQLCENHGGRLPIADTRNKTELMVRLIITNSVYPAVSRGAFLGAKKLTGVKFLWNNNQPVPSASSPESFWFKGTSQVPQPGDCFYLLLQSQTMLWGWVRSKCSQNATDILCELKPKRGP